MIRRIPVAVFVLGACAGAGRPVHMPVIAPPPVAVAPPPAPASVPVVTTPDAPFRQHAPEPLPTAAFTPPVITTFTLGNGVTVMLVERHELPIVTVQYVSRRGGDDLRASEAGLASFTGVMLEQGTRAHDALALSDAFAALGADHSAGIGWDSTGASVQVLTSELEPALGLLAEVVQTPAFADAEIERQRAQRLTALRRELDSPGVIAANTAVRVTFGEAHPYGSPSIGTETSVRAFTRARIEQYYRAHAVPTDSALVVVGDVRRATLEPMLARTFGAWRVRAAPAARPPGAAPATAAGSARVVMVDRPGAPQSQVLVVQAGVSRRDPDHVATVVMNTILGGSFSSRINMNLREAHAYTYGARSTFAFRRGAGPFSAGGAIVAASTGPAVHELLAEIERMRTTDVTADELANATARITESLPAGFETCGQTAGAVAELFVHRIPLDEYATFTGRARAVTAADVRRVAMRLLDPAHARVVIVGDRAVVAPQLETLGLGAVEYRAADGSVVPTATSSSAGPPTR